eukprot:GEMP01057229.1.p1 GENE.GEMP01057229.1~~GEMP01057229.1.p1  ORF type:complete len:240 (+),score=59.46 GEMP01057229.1:54-773(+)
MYQSNISYRQPKPEAASRDPKDYDSSASRLKPPPTAKKATEKLGERLKPPPKSNESKQFFTQEEQSQIGAISYDAQDDKLRELCKATIGLYKGNISKMDVRKQIVQYDAMVQRYEMQYNSASLEVKRIAEEKQLVEEKTKVMREKLLELFVVLEESRRKRKERMETENLADVVSAKKPRKELDKEIENADDDLQALLQAQQEIEKKKTERAKEIERLSKLVHELRNGVTADLSLGGRMA